MTLTYFLQALRCAPIRVLSSNRGTHVHRTVAATQSRTVTATQSPDEAPDTAADAAPDSGPSVGQNFGPAFGQHPSPRHPQPAAVAKPARRTRLATLATLATLTLGPTGGVQSASAGHPDASAGDHVAAHSATGGAHAPGHTPDPYLNTLPSGNPNRVVVNAPVPVDLSADVMAGIEGVYLVLEPFSADFSGWKRGPQQVAEQVRTRLEAAGIPLLSKSEYEARSNAAALVLALHANANSYGFYSYAWKIVVSDKEPLNGASNWLARPLWSTGENGVLVPGNFAAFDANLDKTVDRFIDAYAARNRG